MLRKYSCEKYLPDFGENPPGHRISGNQFSYGKRDTELVFCDVKKNVHIQHYNDLIVFTLLCFLLYLCTTRYLTQIQHVTPIHICCT